MTRTNDHRGHANLPLLTMNNVVKAGDVEDIKSMIVSSTVALTLLWSGRYRPEDLGTPVVATTKGAAGLDAEAGTHLFVADEPEEFADCIVRLLSDSQLRQRLAGFGNQFVQTRYD